MHTLCRHPTAADDFTPPSSLPSKPIPQQYDNDDAWKRLRRCDLLLCNRRCELLHIGTASMARLLLLNAIVRTISHHNAQYHTIVWQFVVIHVLLRRFLLLFIPKNKVTAERKLRFLSKTGDRNGKYRNPEDSGRNRQPSFPIPAPMPH